MKHWAMGIAGLTLVVSALAVSAQGRLGALVDGSRVAEALSIDDTKMSEPQAEAWRGLKQRWDEAMAKAVEAREAAAKGEGGRRAGAEVFAKMRPNLDEYAPVAIGLIEADPKSATALEALQWLIAERATGDVRSKALDLLVAHHLQSEAVAELLPQFRRDVEPAANAFLEKVSEKATTHATRGIALFLRAQNRLEQLKIAGRCATSPDNKKYYLGRYGADVVAALMKLDRVEQEKQAEKELSRVVSEFETVSFGSGRRTTEIAPEAERLLFEIQNLSIGKVAPDIVAEDIDGVEFKLSDYRGKVVVLDFWGDW